MGFIRQFKTLGEAKLSVSLWCLWCGLKVTLWLVVKNRGCSLPHGSLTNDLSAILILKGNENNQSTNATTADPAVENITIAWIAAQPLTGLSAAQFELLNAFALFACGQNL